MLRCIAVFILKSFLTAYVFFFVVTNARAANVTSASDRISREQVKVQADHEIRFTTQSGVDASTDTITLTFAPGFDPANVGILDVDFYHGTTTGLEHRMTLASSSSLNVWGTSISGQTITLSAPTNAASGLIATGQRIVIRIGTNTVSGSNRIVNPSTAGVYSIAVGGTFGDSGVMMIPIVSQDSFALSFMVPFAGGGAGPGGGAGAGGSTDGPSAVPPIVSGVQAMGVTTSTAFIAWQTSQLSDSKVEYGDENRFADGNVYNGTRTTGHSVLLTGLIPDHTYYLRVTSRDAVGNVAAFTNASFRTAALPRPAVVSGLMTVNVTDVSALVLWVTDVDATSLVEYGVTENFGLSASTLGSGASHAVALTGLSASTTYFFRIVSTEEHGLTSYSSTTLFITRADLTPPANASEFQAFARNREIVLQWMNPEDEDFSHVILVRRDDRQPTSPIDGFVLYRGTNERIVDNGLQGGRQYYYTLYAFDHAGNFSSGALATAIPTERETRIPVVEPPVKTEQPNGQPVLQQEPGPNQAQGFIGPMPVSGAQGGSSHGETFPSATSAGTIPILPSPSAMPREPSPPPQMEDRSVPPVSLAVIPIPIPTPQGNYVTIRPEFYTQNGDILLSHDSSGKVGVLSKRAIMLRVPILQTGILADSGSVMIGESTYALTPSQNGESLAAVFTPPSKPNEVPLNISVRFTNGAVATERRILINQPYGHVFERGVVALGNIPLEGVTITLYERSGEELILWDARSRQQVNPIRTGKDGAFAFIVPNGLYEIRMKKDGYIDGREVVEASRNVLARDVALRKKPLSPLKVIDPKASLAQNAKAVARETALLVGAGLEAVQTPEAQAAVQRVVAPTIVTVAVANTSSAVSVFQALTYVKFLVTQPLLLIRRRKRTKWGTVYNSLTKQPVDLAIIRMVHAVTGLLAQTRITDSQGRFSFLARSGEYKFEVIKKGYKFPTVYLQGMKEDVDMLDLYHGDKLEVKEDAVIAMNIPVDPEENTEAPRTILMKKALRQVQRVLGLLSFVVMFVAFVIAPTFLMGILTAAQGMIYLLFKRLAVPSKPKDWGWVFDHATQKALDRSIVRIFDKKFNKLLETQITGTSGKYGFFVGKNIYYVTAEREGYQHFKSSDMDLISKSIVAIELPISLEKPR